MLFPLYANQEVFCKFCDCEFRRLLYSIPLKVNYSLQDAIGARLVSADVRLEAKRVYQKVSCRRPNRSYERLGIPPPGHHFAGFVV